MEGLFFEIGMILIVAAVLSMIVYRFKQPLIIAYIITGIIAGPSLFALARSGDVIDLMAEIGIAFLLFTVGLGLNWRNIKDIGGIALATGVGQVLFTTVVGFLIGQLLGLSVMVSIYLAVAFTFSSTIIVIKLLMDKEELDTLYGRISVGFLLVQDFIAMFILLGLGAFASGGNTSDVLIQSLFKGVIIIPILWFVSAKIVPRIVGYAAKTQELLFIFAVAWCFLIAGILVWLGFGLELGALIAGVTLSGTMYEREINARIRPLRDFFLIIFFIVLGTQLNLGVISDALVPAIIFSLFILIGNPLIVMLIMRGLGYHPRTGFLAGTTVAQISEFSFIVIAAGISIGHLGEHDLALATFVGLATIAASSYLIEKNDRIYEFLKPMFRWLEPKDVLKSEIKIKQKTPQIILFGFHKIGEVILKTIRDMKQSYTVVDFDPLVVRELSEVGIPVIYGDAADENFLTEFGADKARFIISTIPDVVVSISILTFLKSRKFKGSAIVAVRNDDEAKICYEAGATYVIIPKTLGGEKLRDLLKRKKTGKQTWKALGSKQHSELQV